VGSRFCWQCGAALAAEDKFCMTCGTPAEDPGAGEEEVPAFLTPHPPSSTAADHARLPDPAPVAPAGFGSPGVQPYQPQAASSGSPFMGLIIGGVILLLVVLGGGGWYGWNLYAKSLGRQPAAAKSGPGASQAAQPGTPAQAPAQDGDGFLGLWAPEEPVGESSGEEVRIVRQGSLLVGTNDSDPKGRIELTVKPGDKLEGFYTDDVSDKVPLTAELIDGGKRLVMTLAPPQSEYETVILMRVIEAEKAAAMAGQDEIPGIVPITGVDEAYAQKVVAQQKEVKEFIDLLAGTGRSPRFEVAEDDPNTWMIRVYEIVDDGDGMSHAATFGWYKVNKMTGAVSPGM